MNRQILPSGPFLNSFLDAFLFSLRKAVVSPVQAFRLQYLPLLMIYFSYGALGIIAVADSFWVKKELTLSPASLAHLSVWLTLPWAVKMIFGEVVDTISILGSRRKVYVYFGASLIATGLLLLSGAAKKILNFLPPENLYITAQIIMVIGVVLQDVVADAMSTEVVPRKNQDGTPRDQREIEHDLGMVQILGRIALSLGAFSVAGLAGFLAGHFSYGTVFLLALVIPLVSASGAFFVKIESSEQRPTDWTILIGGFGFGLVILAASVLQLSYAQELTFLISLSVIVLMLIRITADIDPNTRRHIFYTALIIFFFRATPTVGDGFRWFTIDILGFDEQFYGLLSQIGAAISLLVAWLLSDTITRVPVTKVLLWLTLLTGALSIPNFLLVFRADLWTSEHLGFGAKTIALVDAAAASPLLQISMVPLLTLIAIYAPPSKRAVWFALMASFLNLALIAGQLITKYLNWIFIVERGHYPELPSLVVTAVVINMAMPLFAILIFGRRLP